MLSFSIKRYYKQLHEVFDALLACKSVRGKAELNMPYGKEVFTTLMTALDKAEKLGLDSVNVFGHAGYAEYGTGDEVLAILTHLDVVPEGEGWDTDPFTPVRKDGKVYARGTLDNKCAAAAGIVALAALRDNCVQLDKRVRIIFGCDEESGSSDMEHYLKHEGEPDYAVVPDSHFPIVNGEKGLLHMTLTADVKHIDLPLCIRSITSGSVANIVPNRASAIINAPFETINALVENYAIGLPATFACEETQEGVLITCHGKASHGSAPQLGVNALAYLTSFLGTIPLAPGDIEKFIYAISEKIGLEYDGKRLGIASQEELSGMLTLNLGALHVYEDKIEAKIDIRYPLCADGDEIMKKIEDAFILKNIKAGIIQYKKPHFIKEDSFLVSSLKKTYEECFGEPGVCEIGAGATYARSFKNGVSFGPVTAQRTELEHSPNEFIYEHELEKLLEVICTAIVNIAGDPNSIS